MFVHWKSSLFKGLDPIDHLTLPQISCLSQARTYIIWSLKGVWWIGQVINSCYNQLECSWWWINFSFWKTFLVMKKTTSCSVQLIVRPVLWHSLYTSSDIMPHFHDFFSSSPYHFFAILHIPSEIGEISFFMWIKYLGCLENINWTILYEFNMYHKTATI